jgi:hypothetical protein
VAIHDTVVVAVVVVVVVAVVVAVVLLLCCSAMQLSASGSGLGQDDTEQSRTMRREGMLCAALQHGSGEPCGYGTPA